MTARKYATKAEKLAEMKELASKTERAALYYIEEGMKFVGSDLWEKAKEQWAEANSYSLRWNVV